MPNLYRLGAAGEDPIIIFPGDTLAEMNTVDHAMEQLNWDIENTKVPAEFERSWLGHYAKWKAFRRDSGDWISRGTSGTWNKTREYKVMVNRWRTMFERFGGKPSSPELVEGPPKSMLEKLGTLAAVAGGAVLLWSLLRR